MFSKGIGALEEESENSNSKSSITPRKNWSLLQEEVSLPACVLRIPNYEHNLSWMNQFVNHYGFKLAPHGKTTMCPTLFQAQIKSGGWGITLATAPQVKIARDFGIQNILMANQLVGKQNMQIISEILKDEESSTSKGHFSCIVDSVDNVRSLGSFFQAKNQKLRILLELGVEGGRTGIRNLQQEELVLEEIRKWRSLKLVGIEFYEGILETESDVRIFVQRAIKRTCELSKITAFDEETVLLTGSGSAWFDIVSEEFSNNMPKLVSPYKVEILLRPGCYVVHGQTMYADIEHRLTVNAIIDGPGLRQSLEIWAYVQSRPELELCIVNMGKRDAFHDCGFPVPFQFFRPDCHEKPQRIYGDWQIQKMMDQHTFLKVPVDADIQVGDIIVFQTCHACTVLDKWKYILAVDDNYLVRDIFKTYF